MADWLALALVLLAGIGVGVLWGYRLFAPHVFLPKPPPEPRPNVRGVRLVKQGDDR
jgi:hypothetical protein